MAKAAKPPSKKKEPEPWSKAQEKRVDDIIALVTTGKSESKTTKIPLTTPTDRAAYAVALILARVAGGGRIVGRGKDKRVHLGVSFSFSDNTIGTAEHTMVKNVVTLMTTKGKIALGPVS